MHSSPTTGPDVDYDRDHDHDLAVAIVGMGPRGISVVERIGAALRQRSQPASLTLHLIEVSQHGAGEVWRTDQTDTLCMNTLAGAVTLFTEPGSTVTAPVVEGPHQYDWIRLIRGDRVTDSTADDPASTGPVPAAAAELFDRFPAAPEVWGKYRAELAASRPESNPSRALYGEYLRWVFDIAVATLPDWVTVVKHHARARSLRADADGRDVVVLDSTDGSDSADGAPTEVVADQTILATGWRPPAPTAEEQAFARDLAKQPGLTWVQPGNPVDQDVTSLPARANVLVRGLGMGFFDLMAQVTIDRGGVFHEDPTTRSGLRYEPSGEEPSLTVASGRGYPYLPKSHYRSLPPKAKLRRFREVAARISAENRPQGSIDFGVEVYPAIIKDAYAAYYETLAEVDPAAIRTNLNQIIDAIDAAEEPEQLLRNVAGHLTDPDRALNLRTWSDPLGGVHGTVAELTTWIGEQMALDIEQAVLARRSPLKAALWEISASRKPSQILGAEGRYTFESRRGRYAELMAFGQMVGSGPPLFRTRELLALVDAGLVRFAGARPSVTVRDGAWELTSPTTRDVPQRAAALVDAWMHSPDVRSPGDGLTRSLIDDSRARPFTVHAADGTPAPTGSPEVDPGTRRLVHPNGSLDPRVRLIGIPTHAQHPDTTISPMPGTDPLMLQETDRAAVDVLGALGLY